MANSKPNSLPSPKNRTFLQSWLALPARTRLYVSLGVCVVAGTGIMISDFLENSPPPPHNLSTKTASGSASQNLA
ncbi:hypothetical protein BDZ97DRAFT_1913628 [Flammula alnicola]|nr:hypothetical protein BDZ97DRAFT_1913628 [Flammula alnicola]